MEFKKDTMTDKYIHRGLPTQSKLYQQGQEASPTCPRCQRNLEIQSHIFSCETDSSIEEWNKTWATTLQSLQKMGTAPDILAKWNTQIRISLNILASQLEKMTIRGCKTRRGWIQQVSENQMRIGWDLFMRGFIINDWKELQAQYEQCHPYHKKG